MKAKKLILLSCVFIAHIINAGRVHHKMISMTEQHILGQTFKHVMISGGVEKDEFFMNGHIVTRDSYLQELEELQKKEREDEFLQQESFNRSRIEFADMVQVEITAKLLNKIVMQIVQLFEKIENPALEKFFVFTDGTIESYNQLMQLQDFAQQLDVSIQKKIVHNDFEGLNLLFTKMEHWPERLEKFFQNTVQNAIKKSDDTMMLKELLKLVC